MPHASAPAGHLLSPTDGPDQGRTEQIVQAAYTLLDEGGLAGLTIRAVLSRTGLSRRAFYERFGGKDDLVLAVFKLSLRRAADHWSGDAMADIADPLERLRRIVMGILLDRRGPSEASHGNGEQLGAAMSREHLRLAHSRPDDLQEALQPLLQVLAAQLAEGMASGVVRPAQPERLARLVYNIVATTVHTEMLATQGSAPDLAGRQVLAGELWEFCRRAIAA